MLSRRFAWIYWKARRPSDMRMVTIMPPVFLFAALALLVFPLKWILAAFISAFVHEICHILMIRSLRLRINAIRIGLSGAKIETGSMSYIQEALCALAGPLGAMCLLFAGKWMPRVAICAAFQSAYNLLPVYPNDGGRVLLCVTQMLLPNRIAECLCDCIAGIILLLLAFLGVYGTFFLNLGILPLVTSWVFVIKAIKIPCKQGRHKVQ